MLFTEIVNFQVADAFNIPSQDNNFDLVQFLLTGQYILNKTKFLKKYYRLLKPGVTLILATWIHPPINSLADELTMKTNTQHKFIGFVIYSMLFVYLNTKKFLNELKVIKHDDCSIYFFEN